MSRPAPRFARQVRLPQLGEAGQQRLLGARVAIAGVGATGSHLAEALARAGVGAGSGGWLRLIDRDIVEVSNLPRQQLFGDADAQQVRPKAQAAAEALVRIDPALHVEPCVEDLTAANVARLLDGAHLVLDGTDNFPTRFLLNDACVSRGVPWVYCGVVGTEGQVLPVLPGGPCLRCYVPEPPPPGSLPTCDTAGVLGSVVGTISSLSATLALRVLLGAPPEDAAGSATLLALDGWGADLRRLLLRREPDCPCCVRRDFAFLRAVAAAEATELCGRDAVQLPATGAVVDLPALAEALRAEGEANLTTWVLRLDLPARGPAAGRRVLVFRDGRVIVGGTRDPSEARAVRARL
ncbi:MAG: thiazole biosynthesis adenylyltransferase ThiF, partial [Planctomycetes bacterium]|nr:thiazole biosynthesis adenylyltransferase ThiF [Planctomycetota bacterium]